MSLFERISNKITEEKRKQRDNSYLFDDDKDSSGSNKNRNKRNSLVPVSLERLIHNSKNYH